MCCCDTVKHVQFPRYLCTKWASAAARAAHGSLILSRGVGQYSSGQAELHIPNQSHKAVIWGESWLSIHVLTPPAGSYQQIFREKEPFWGFSLLSCGRGALTAVMPLCGKPLAWGADGTLWGLWCVCAGASIGGDTSRSLSQVRLSSNPLLSTSQILGWRRENLGSRQEGKLADDPCRSLVIWSPEQCAAEINCPALG